MEKECIGLIGLGRMGQVKQLLSLILAQGKGQKAHTVLATAIEEFTGVRFSEWK